MSEDKKQMQAGGAFLISETKPEDIFIPEEWDEEQKMIAETCTSFLDQEVTPNLDRIDSMEEGLMSELVGKAGELGMLGVSVPEEYGGFGKDFNTSMLVAEKTGSGHSFAVAMTAHTGIGTLPILYYGNEEQKKKYVPKLANGEWKASYCLTEPGAGSDANSGKTHAQLSDDGKHYILNGQKMWITNGGFAHVFIVFAKIDDDENLSAFILERDYNGIQINAEEKKMGIKGSSTVQVFFNDVKVPVENLLYERGAGFKIALNILNFGRIKLAGACLGGAKQCVTHSVIYANEREQFGKAIANYGAIKYKLAEQSIRTFVLESATYRCSHDIDDAIKERIDGGMDKRDAVLKGVEQFAAEAAIMKVFGSEVLDYVVDEGVQIYGGMGYSAEAPVERGYRDSRINRIFEGTNEINRMLIIDMLLKKAMKGELDLMGPAMKIPGELMSIPDFSEPGDAPLEAEQKYVKNFKKAVLMVAGAAAQKYMTALAGEQELLLNLADMVIQTYVAESVVLRVLKRIAMQGEAGSDNEMNMARVFVANAAGVVAHAGREAIWSFAEGDEQRIMLMGLKRFTKTAPFNITALRRKIADKLIVAGKYCF